ncbi:MAG: hypothetical protein ACYTGL_19690 [Planctomycetota bacterium]
METLSNPGAAGATPVHLAKACRALVPRYFGDSVSPQTAVRWHNQGLTAADGTKVRLKAFRVGRQLVTTEEWVAEFFAELARRSGVATTQDETDVARRAQELYGAGAQFEVSVPHR